MKAIQTNIHGVQIEAMPGDYRVYWCSDWDALRDELAPQGYARLNTAGGDLEVFLVPERIGRPVSDLTPDSEIIIRCRDWQSTALVRHADPQRRLVSVTLSHGGIYDHRMSETGEELTRQTDGRHVLHLDCDLGDLLDFVLAEQFDGLYC